MAETLTGSLALALTATLTNALDLSTPKDALSYALSQNIASGTGAGQANKLWHDTRTLAASGTEDINLYSLGGALSGVGGTFTLSKVFALLIRNKTTATATNLIVGGKGASTAWTSLFAVNTYTATIRPGGLFLALAPDATGYAVVNTTNHLLKIANADSVNAVDYDIVVIGAQ